MGTFVCSELDRVGRVALVSVFFGVMYGEWYGVCDSVVFSVVEVCADYGGVNVFHVFLYICCDVV